MTVDLIGYASSLGAKKAGCKDGPSALKRAGLERAVKNAVWKDIYVSPLSPSLVPKEEIIADYCRNLCEKTADSVKRGNFPLALGGDHTMAVGTWSGVTFGLDAKEDFGLVWFDAHMDSHTPETSHSGSCHGMPLACLLGYGDPRLCAVGGLGPKLRPEHVCLIGVRSYEPEERRLLERLGVRVFYMQEVRERGMDDVVRDALSIVGKAGGGYGATLDIDALDPEAAPGTGSREKDGLTAEEVLRAIDVLAATSRLKAWEIAEFDPHLDKEGRTERLAFEAAGRAGKGR
jgi:arginase